MSIVGIKKILLAGTALVAVSAFSLQAQAAGTTNVAVTTTESAPIGEAAQPAGNPGLVGDAGITLTAGSTVATPLILTLGAAGTVTGQAGAAGSVSTAVPQVGGAGVFFNGESGVATAVLSLVNDAGTTGITGGAGGNAFSSAGAASATQAGANGGVGVNLGIGGFTSLTGTGAVTGGAGGIGSFGNGASTAGGAGGNGFGGIRVSGANATVNDSGLIKGGDGGAGGSPTGVTSIGGVGGNGGNGIHLDTTSAVATATITANVTGGAGGNSGVGTVVPNAAAGGIGGNGILIEGATDTVTITGAATTVAGGAGGNSLLGTSGALAVTGAAGGDGINIDGGSGTIITNAGIIKGGIGGAGVAAGLSGNAINISAAIGTLTNTGTIGSATTQTSSALVLGGVVTTFNNTGGTITNDSTTVGNATVVISANQGAILSNAGAITNANTADTAFALDMLSAQTAAITNASTGTISAVGAGSLAAPTGTAVHFGNNSALIFNNAGHIYGNITDVGIATTPTLVNTGTILGNIVLNDALDTNTKTVTLTSGTVTGVGITNATIDMSTVAGINTVSQAAGTVTGTTLGAILFGTGANSFTQTGGTLSSLAASNAAPVITGGGGNTTLTLGGGSIIGLTDLGGGANVMNVNGTFTTDGDFTATAGSIALTSGTGGTLNVANAITAGTGAVAVTGSGIINVNAGGSITNSGAVTTAGTGSVNLVGGGITSTGALTNNGTVAIYTGNTLAAASQTAGTGTFNFSVTGTPGTGVMTSGLLNLTAGGLTMAGSTIRASVANGSSPIATGSVTEIAAGSAPVVSLPNGGVLTTAVAVASGTDLYSFQYALGTNATVLLADPAATNAQIYLIATKNALFTQPSITSNDLSANGALTAFGNEGVSATPGEVQLNTIITTISAEPTAAAVHNALQSLTPTVDGGSQVAALNVVAQTQDIADNRMAALRDGDPLSGVAAGATANGVSMWYEGYGQHANQNAMGGVNGYNATTWGGAIGVDSGLMEDEGIFGIAFNYGHAAINSDNANTTLTDLGNYGVNTYATIHFGPTVFMNGQLGYAYNTIDSYRHNADLAGDTADGKTHSNQYSSKIDMGRDYSAGGNMINNNWELNPMTLTPEASIAYTYLHTQGYTESGAGGADNTVASNNQNVLALGIGGTVAWKIRSDDGSVVKPSLHAGYAYDAVDTRVQTASSFAGDPAANIFTTTGASPSRNIFDAGAKIVYMSMADWDFSANYDFQFKQDYTSNTGELRATTHF